MKKNSLGRKKLIFFSLFIVIILITYLTLFSNVFLQFVFHEKIWVHRVNSIEKLEEVKKDFFGVEVDVVFLESLNVFDVTHPPEPSISLNLLTYLNFCKLNQIHVWLDFKNLNERNAEESLARLNSICSELSLNKENFIIESTNYKSINLFENNGYEISYYLPWPGLFQLKGDSLLNMLSEIESNIEKNNLNQISSNYHDYQIMKKRFPAKSKLFWLTGNNHEFTSSIKERLYLYEILMDEKVKILLMEYESEVRNR
ncbi:MAG: hypothetical protein JKY30_00135 [Flavobacteriales bacterium]|nr:hypothetical protein [Flavobacteriales bacterium]